MSVEELKAKLLGKSYPETVQISVDQKVIDVDLFLKVAFIEVEKWQKDIEKCPGYVRLIKFMEATESI